MEDFGPQRCWPKQNDCHLVVNIVSHSTRCLGHRPTVGFDAKAVVTETARAGTALEVNGFPDRLDLDDELARLTVDSGALFGISSEAHATRHLDNIRYGVATAERGWIPTSPRPIRRG